MTMLVTGASEGKLAFNYVGVTRGRDSPDHKARKLIIRMDVTLSVAFHTDEPILNHLRTVRSIPLPLTFWRSLLGQPGIVRFPCCYDFLWR